MLRKPFFSVVIPTLNEEDYLPKILADLAKQKRKNFEIIVVDAASEDKTKEEALKFSKYFPLKFIDTDKRNVSFQRNLGAQKSAGNFLVFLDADARIDTNFIENLYENILKKKGLLFLPVLIAEDRSSKNKVLFKLINYVIELSQSLTKPLSPGGSIFINKKIFLTLDGFRENFFMNEDHNLVQRARKIGIKAKILKDIEVAFSLRRVKKEGQTIFLYKNFMALVFLLINGGVTNKIFRYEMGGDKYKNFKREPTLLRKFLKKTSTFLSDSLS